jgi:uncharacterized membrane protein YhaH (DUF805 family)
MNGELWYCMVDGQRNGPYTVEQFRAMAADSPPPRDMPVWTEGMTDWRPLGDSPLAAALGVRPVPPTSGAPRAEAGAPQTPGAIGFADAVRLAFARYADFNGRATRPEFWWFYLLILLVQIGLAVVELAIGSLGTMLYWLVTLAMALPLIAVAVRRLHDTDRSGWWYFLILAPLIGVIVLIVFWCQRGTAGRNRFG